MSKHPRTHPLFGLPREDLDLIQELVLQSGSLKGLAKSYGVSYPTIRARLDRVIERLQGVLEGVEPDPVAETLARLVERGEMSGTGARAVLELVRDERQRQPAAKPSPIEADGQRQEVDHGMVE